MEGFLKKVFPRAREEIGETRRNPDTRQLSASPRQKRWLDTSAPLRHMGPGCYTDRLWGAVGWGLVQAKADCKQEKARPDSKGVLGTLGILNVFVCPPLRSLFRNVRPSTRLLS